MEKVGRNDPCPCGSGKKYKNCHRTVQSTSGGKNKALIIGGLFVLFLIIGIVGYVLNSSEDQGSSGNQFSPGPPPPGPAPPGKVWSYEHGHWHDA